jgi:hypothetical protein
MKNDSRVEENIAKEHANTLNPTNHDSRARCDAVSCAEQEETTKMTISRCEICGNLESNL